MISHMKTGPSRHAELMSDKTLMQAFVDGFIRGDSVLLANQNLKTEPLFDSMQLLSTREGIVATAYPYAAPMSIVLRTEMSYGERLHQLLADQCFYPLMQGPVSGCYQYQFCEPPAGYSLYCTTARELWRACWGRGFGIRSGIPLDLLVWRQGPSRDQNQWYSLRGMDCDQGQLMVKMLGWTDTVQGDDLVVWARQLLKTAETSERPDMASTRSRTDLRGGYIPFRQ